MNVYTKMKASLTKVVKEAKVLEAKLEELNNVIESSKDDLSQFELNRKDFDYRYINNFMKGACEEIRECSEFFDRTTGIIQKKEFPIKRFKKNHKP